MKFTITQEFLPAKEYLTIKGYSAFSNENAPAEYAEWVRMCGELNINGLDCFPDNDLNKKVKKLLAKSGASEVHALYCNSCRYDEQIGTWIVGYDIACENVNHAQAGDGFEIVRLDPSEYLVIDYSYGEELTREQAWKEIDDYFWGEWLTNNPYESMIGGDHADNRGTADIGLSAPGRIVEWHAIRRKEGESS